MGQVLCRREQDHGSREHARDHQLPKQSKLERDARPRQGRTKKVHPATREDSQQRYTVAMDRVSIVR